MSATGKSISLLGNITVESIASTAWINFSSTTTKEWFKNSSCTCLESIIWMLTAGILQLSKSYKIKIWPRGQNYTSSRTSKHLNRSHSRTGESAWVIFQLCLFVVYHQPNRTCVAHVFSVVPLRNSLFDWSTGLTPRERELFHMHRTCTIVNHTSGQRKSRNFRSISSRLNEK